MKLTFAHIIGYVAGGLGVVAGLNPTVVAAMVGPGAAVYVAPVVAGAGAALVFLHDIGLIPSKPGATITSVAKMLPLFLALAIPLAVCISLSGCATAAVVAAGVTTVDTVVTGPAAQPFIEAGVLAAVTEAERKGITAAQINSVAKQALAADSGTTATLAEVAALVNAQLDKLDLPAGDMQAASVIEGALNVAIGVVVGANPTVAATQAATADVLQAIITATGG